MLKLLKKKKKIIIKKIVNYRLFEINLIKKLYIFSLIKKKKKKLRYLRWVYKKFLAKNRKNVLNYLKYIYIKFLVKFKEFIKRRNFFLLKKGFFYYKMFLIRKQKYLERLSLINIILKYQIKQLNQIKFYLGVKLTKNNLFIYIFSKLKTKFFSYLTNGIAGFKGPVRSSPLVGEKAGFLLGIKARRFGIRNVTLLLYKRFNKRLKECLKGLRKSKLKINKIIITPKIAHNGSRFAKKRRK